RMSADPTRRRIPLQSLETSVNCRRKRQAHSLPCNSPLCMNALTSMILSLRSTIRIPTAHALAFSSRKVSQTWQSRMRTTLLSTSSLLILSRLACASSEATACSFAIQYGTKLEASATTLSNEDRVHLAELAISARGTVADRGPVSVYGFADEHQ